MEDEVIGSQAASMWNIPVRPGQNWGLETKCPDSQGSLAPLALTSLDVLVSGQ